VNVRERGRGQLGGVARTKTRLDDAQEILAKMVERTAQCVRRGSDQAERPVTTSNFFKRELTTWGALS
jgi:hypothetical protein